MDTNQSKAEKSTQGAGHDPESSTDSGNSTDLSAHSLPAENTAINSTVEAGKESISVTPLDPIDAIFAKYGALKSKPSPLEQFQIAKNSDLSTLDNRWEENLRFILNKVAAGENTFVLLADAASGKSIQSLQLAERFRVEHGGVSVITLGNIVRNGMNQLSKLDTVDRNDIQYTLFDQLCEFRDYLKHATPPPPALVVIDEASVNKLNKQDLLQARGIQLIKDLRDLGATFVFIGHPNYRDPDTMFRNIASWTSTANSQVSGEFFTLYPRVSNADPMHNTTLAARCSSDGKPIEVRPLNFFTAKNDT